VEEGAADIEGSEVREGADDEDEEERVWGGK
jgi:hypothetical protein